MNYQQIWDSFKFAINYLPQTLILVFVPFAICIAFGLVIAVVRVWKIPVLSQLLQAWVLIIKGIPIYLFLIIANLLYNSYFDKLAEWLGIGLRVKDIDVMYFGIFIFSVIFTPAISEIIRGSLIAISHGQYEAGYAVGLKRFQILRRIILPQVVPKVVPSMTSMLIGLLKASALVYTLGITDILNAAIRSASIAYDLLEGYIAAAIIYWILSIIIEKAMGLLADYIGRYEKALEG